MMNCQEARRNIWPYLDLELESDLRRDVTDHLDRCDECLTRFRSEESVELSVRRSMLLGAPTARLWDRIEAGLDAADSQVASPVRPSYRRFLPVAAAVLLVALGTSYVVLRTDDRPATTVAYADLGEELHEVQLRADRGDLAPDLATSDWPVLCQWVRARRNDLQFKANLDTGGMDGLELVGARATSVQGQGALVIFLRDRSGAPAIPPEPILLVVLEERQAKEEFPALLPYLIGDAVKPIDVGPDGDGIQAVARIKSGALAAAIGRLPEDRLRRIVEEICHKLTGEPVAKPEG